MQTILYTHDAASALRAIIDTLPGTDRVVWLADAHTCHIAEELKLQCTVASHTIVVGAGDDHKNIETLVNVWQELQQAGATRHSLLINVGGGMVTDLGGFAAATFKRGIRFVNVPTTLLAMIDASVGGKTGINFGGYKNEIGAFKEADYVVVCTEFLRTLDEQNFRSGYAEMLKHALLKDKQMLVQHLQFDIASPDYAALLAMVKENIEFKSHIVEQDPTERGLRKALNLGHTVGHAIESLMLRRATPVLHGYAVAWGLVCELFMASTKLDFPTEHLYAVTRYVTTHYGRPEITCDDYDELRELMLHDKKNTAGVVNFTQLAEVGKIILDQTAEASLINDAFDYLREA